MFETHSDLFYTERVENENHVVENILNLHPLTEGNDLAFYWQEMRQESPLGAPSFISITDEIISSIDVLINDDVSLGRVIEKLGAPSNVWLSDVSFMQYLSVYYKNLRLVVIVWTFSDTCSKGVLNEFAVQSVSYLNTDQYLELWLSDTGHAEYIPPKIWNVWQRMSSDDSCLTALRELTRYAVSLH